MRIASAALLILATTHAQVEDDLNALDHFAALREKAAAAAKKAAAAAGNHLQNAASRVEELHDKAENAAPSVSDRLSDGWTSMVSASNALTDEMAHAVEHTMEGTVGVLQKMLGVTEEMLSKILTGGANLIFCALMLYGYLKLPADFMLLVGLVTFLVGPAIVMGVFGLLGQLGVLAVRAALSSLTTVSHGGFPDNHGSLLLLLPLCHTGVDADALRRRPLWVGRLQIGRGTLYAAPHGL